MSNFLRNLENLAFTYEVHVTVALPDKLSLYDKKNDFIELCKKIKAKPIIIELEDGVPVNGKIQWQTSKYYHKTLNQVINLMQNDVDYIETSGWQVVRKKIETIPSSNLQSNVPLTQYDLEIEPTANYFEFHIKFVVPENMNIILNVCKKHNAHISKNAITKTVLQSFKIITLRLYKICLNDSIDLFNALYNDLIKINTIIVKTEKEYAVYDSNSNIDKGWIDFAS